MRSEHKNFITTFKPAITIVSPGRVNLMGGHTDYNLGYVLPTAIDRHIKIQFCANGTKSQCNVLSVNYDALLRFDFETITVSQNQWENYILGVVKEIIELTSEIRGFDCVIYSDLPIGSGISSSAALECGLAYGLNALFELELTKKQIILLSQRAEHHFVGMQCGIMDQFASVMSKEGKVIFLDCKDISHRYVDAHFDPYKLVLLNSNVHHNLVGSDYNTRRKECEDVVQCIATECPEIKSLRDLSEEVLKEYEGKLSSVQYNRASYVLEENKRVVTAIDALEKRDIQKFGELMYQSHRGLQLKYEVSCPELDFLVDFSEAYEMVLGSRMMGGGFGGCTINLIHENAISSYISKIKKAYKSKFNIDLASHLISPGKGTHMLTQW